MHFVTAVVTDDYRLYVCLFLRRRYVPIVVPKLKGLEAVTFYNRLFEIRKQRQYPWHIGMGGSPHKVAKSQQTSVGKCTSETVITTHY